MISANKNKWLKKMYYPGSKLYKGNKENEKLASLRMWVEELNTWWWPCVLVFTENVTESGISTVE